jgi:acetoin utilization deacetylase AcuC-like enzyme
MLPFKLVYSDAYRLPIGQHVFPAEKYRLVARCVLDKGIATAGDFVTPQPAEDHEVLLAHGDYYVHKLRTGTLTAREELAMEVPFSDELVDAFWLNAGGSILAARRALEDRVSFSLGGGFHHAFPDHGEGFCMINDIAIAIRVVQREKRIGRAMVVDCDVHQGNGTAVIFGRRPKSDAGAPPFRPVLAEGGGVSTVAPPFRPPLAEGGGVPSLAEPKITRDEYAWMREAPIDEATNVFTISLHQENNYPPWKPPSSIDVNIADGVEDQPYLDWLQKALEVALAKFQPELIAYVAGADPYCEDQLGGLSLSIDGLRRRDELVLRLARERRIPVFVTLAGGYAQKIEDTITIHCNTVQAAREIYGTVAGNPRKT